MIKSHWHSVMFQHAFRYVLCSAFTEIASENWFVGMNIGAALNPPWLHGTAAPQIPEISTADPVVFGETPRDVGPFPERHHAHLSGPHD
jgi:hypothetical protein